mmetsp:Transcript_21562/g.64208  ORF Transcript_21562/g.64208 Transcript_21562/m.64208 type:complete len:448 (-) Transcript_21562:309-1652(-)
MWATLEAHWVTAAAVVAVTVVVFNPALLKRGLILAAAGYKAGCRALLALQGHTATSDAERRVCTGEAWDDFCDTLKAAGATVLSGPSDPLSQAEGYRYLSRIARAGIENFVECADPDAPILTSIVDGHRAAPCKLGSDNPDNLYQNATIDGRRHYLVRGTRGTVHYLEFSTKAGQYGQPGGLKTVGSIEAADLVFKASDAFELLVGPTAVKGYRNYLPTDADVEEGRGLFMIRQTFLDRSTEVPATISIVPFDNAVNGGPAPPVGHRPTPRPFTCTQLDEGLRSAGLLAAAAPIMFAKWASEFKGHANQLPLFNVERSNAVGGDPAIRYYHSYWALGLDEALMIEATPPKCSTWNFQLNNYWMESLDYRYHPVCVNKHTARYGPDGSVRIVVSHTKPREPKDGGAPYNWVDTAGHADGTMCFRWVKAEVPDAELPQPTTRVIDVDKL